MTTVDLNYVLGDSLADMILEYDQVVSTIKSATAEEIDYITEYSKLSDGSCQFDGIHVYSGYVRHFQSLGMQIICFPKMDGLRIQEINSTIGDRVLREYQVRCIKKSLLLGRGIIVVATGGGKTLIAGATIRELEKLGFHRVTFLVPTGYLLQQTLDNFKDFGIDASGVGYGLKYKSANVQVCIAKSALSSLSKMDGLGKHIVRSDVLMLDEAHHSPAKTWAIVCEKCNARFRFAYTATAYDNPNSDLLSDRDKFFIGLIGNPIVYVRASELIEQGYLAEPIVTFIRVNSSYIFNIWNPGIVYKLGIVNNNSRNRLIAKLAYDICIGGYKVMIFAVHLKHCSILANMLASTYGLEILVVTGGKKTSIYKPSGGEFKLRWELDDVRKYVDERESCILICSSVFDEGIDLPNINALIMAPGMKKYRRYVQRSGRGMRPKEGNNKVFIFDFYDQNHKFLKNNSEDRIEVYQAEGFRFSESIFETSKMMGIDINLLGV